MNILLSISFQRNIKSISSLRMSITSYQQYGKQSISQDGIEARLRQIVIIL